MKLVKIIVIAIVTTAVVMLIYNTIKPKENFSGAFDPSVRYSNWNIGPINEYDGYSDQICESCA